MSSQKIILQMMTLFAEGLTLTTPYVLGLFAGAQAVIAFLFKLLLASKEREFAALLKERDAAIVELESMRKSHQQIAVEALELMTKITNESLVKKNQMPIVPLVAVVAEGSSPSTERQKQAAQLQTMRARMAAVKLALGEPPRPQQK